MKVICRIKDEDIGQRSIKFLDANPKKGVYGIIQRDDKIAVINVSNRGYYLLPGGVISEDEDFRSAFINTINKQTGCKIDIEKVIGAVEEERCLLRYKQTSYVYIAKVIEYNEKSIYSEEEKFNDVKIEWINEDRALTIVATSYDNLDIDDAEDLYNIKFNVKKSQAILEEYLKNK